MIARLLLLLVLLAAAVGLATFVAGEQIEVVVLRTYDAEGISYDTKMWVVDLEETGGESSLVLPGFEAERRRKTVGNRSVKFRRN